jgi:hypothetical protein
MTQKSSDQNANEIDGIGLIKRSRPNSASMASTGNVEGKKNVQQKEEAEKMRQASGDDFYIFEIFFSSSKLPSPMFHYICCFSFI